MAKPSITKKLICQISPVVIAQDLSKEGHKSYLGFPDVKSMLKYVKKQPDQHFYEVAIGAKNRKLYFDFDKKTSEGERPALAEFINNATEVLVESVFALFGVEIGHDSIVFTNSSTKSKCSFHIHIPTLNTSVANMKILHRVVAQTMGCMNPIYNKVDESQCLDASVYNSNQCFRLTGSCKMGKYNIKKIVGDSFNTEDTLIGVYEGDTSIKLKLRPELKAKLCKLVKPTPPDITKPIEPTEDKSVQKAIKLYTDCSDSVNHNMTSYKVKTMHDGNLEISFKRTSASHCDICNKAHDSDNTAILLVCLADNKVFKKCYKPTSQGSAVFIGHLVKPVDISCDPVQVETVQVEPANAKSFIGKAIVASTKKSVPKLEAEIINGFKGTCAQVHRYDSKYCSENEAIINSKATIIGQRASMGTGKTNACATRAIKHYNDLDHRYMVMSFRISLSDQLKNDKFANDPNIVCYKDIKGKLTAPHLIIQPESLHRYGLHKGDREYLIDEIFIDEATQVKRQFTGDTFINNPNAHHSYKMFKHIIKNAKHVHLMDANLDASVIQWIQTMRGNTTDSIDIFWNDHKNLKGREISIAASEFDILHQVKADLADGKRVYVASNSKAEKIRAYADMVGVGKSVLCISSETLNEPHVKLALSNPNDEWGKYDVVICSPSVQSGISYDKTDVFDSVYGIFGNYSSGSSDCCQMLNRVRQPKNNKTVVSIAMGNNNIGAITESGIINHMKYNREHTNDAIRLRIESISGLVDYEIDNYGHREFAQTDLFKLIVQNKASSNRDLNYFIWNFIRNHHIEGYKVSEFDPLIAFDLDSEKHEALKKAYRKTLKAIRGKNSMTDSTFISEAINKSIDEIAKITADLSSNIEITKEDKDALLKYNITTQYSVDTQQTPEWFDTYGKLKNRHIFNNQNRLLKHNTFDEALVDIKKVEMLAATKTVEYIFDPNRDIALDDAMVLGAINFAKAKPKLEKYTILCEWMKTLGFDSIDSSTTRTSAEIKESLKNIHRTVLKKPSHIIKTLDKHIRKMDVITKMKHDDAKFTKNMIDFVNGSLRSEFGISIKKKGRRDENYTLDNAFLDESSIVHFNNVNRLIDDQTLNGATPCIGVMGFDIREVLPTDGDPYDSDDEE